MLRIAPPEGIGLILPASPAWCFTVLNLPATMIALVVMNLLGSLPFDWLRDACSIAAY
ncbi:MAG: hypothetical protein IPJ98_06660 [Bryobacterales bacterium]|nr:hypothetical protein [Bryobacterales bacterium]